MLLYTQPLHPNTSLTFELDSGGKTPQCPWRGTERKSFFYSPQFKSTQRSNVQSASGHNFSINMNSMSVESVKRDRVTTAVQTFDLSTFDR